MIELSGNELGWIIRLAEGYVNSEGFKGYRRRHLFQGAELHSFLQELLARFHPNNFNCGNSRTKWILISAKELEELKKN